MSFQGAHPSLVRTLTARAYVDPTPVQRAILAENASDQDLLVSAQTGSGKTVAFGLALAATLLKDTERFAPAPNPRALIITPTRELAQQVSRELQWLFAETGARVATCVGGMDPRREQQALAAGAHVVVGTPGRLCDHLTRGALVLGKLEACVLDEADEMLDMGFREDLERLLDASPRERRTLMFSATIPKDIATLAKRYQRQAHRIETTSATERHGDIEYRAVEIMGRDREAAIVNLLRFHEVEAALVFCATRDGVTRLAANLNERGFSAVALSGELSQRERNSALKALRDGRARVCIATDVAARGLDLPNLDLVIHADLPLNSQVLVHRSGRTGRAGKHGIAILIVPETARRYAERLLGGAHVIASWKPAPSAQEIRQRDNDSLAEEIKGLAANVSDEDRDVARSLVANHAPEDLVAALVRIRREMHPTPEDVRPLPPRNAGHKPPPANMHKKKHKPLPRRHFGFR